MSTNADPMADRAPVVVFQGLGLTYPGPPAVEAIQDCDLTVHRGQFVAIVGPSGSGKSSLLNIVGLLDKATTGSYELDGINTGALSDVDRAAVRARRIGFVFQAFHLLPHRTAAENVMLGLLYSGVHRKQRSAIARDALERVGLSHRINALPTTLSGGERQRVAIARALAGQPSLLLCDEPTGNLDSTTADTVLALITELNVEGVTVLMITHNGEVAARAQRVVRMKDGVLTEQTQGDTG